MAGKRKDRQGRVLKDGEYQRNNGTYSYRWQDSVGNRCSVYAKTLQELREKEEQILRDKIDGIRAESRQLTLNDLFELWCSVKKGIKDNTFTNYKYMYLQFVHDSLGKIKLHQLKRSDVRIFYSSLIENEGLKVNTVDNIHTVLHQVLELGVEDDYIRKNPSDHALKELKLIYPRQEKRKALTVDEQKIFISFVKNSPIYNHWYPLMETMLKTGMRVGEVSGLRWTDIDLQKGIIDINHTLVYYNRQMERGGNRKLHYAINTPKTANSCRSIPMVDSVKEAFRIQKKILEEEEIECNTEIDGYTDFIFLNRFGDPLNQYAINKAIKRIIRDCNSEILDNAKMSDEITLLPNFSCHSLRHTFTTRLCESGINMKVVQEVLGHSDFALTMNIYADATQDLKDREFVKLDKYFDEM